MRIKEKQYWRRKKKNMIIMKMKKKEIKRRKPLCVAVRISVVISPCLTEV
jgi:hypothetical protein